MFAHDISLPNRRARAERPTNLATASECWGADMPNWVRLLALACDTTNQREVAERLGKSSPYVSRIVRKQYPGDLAEAERLVRAAYGREDVLCPVWGKPIPLSSCMTQRRRKGPPQGEIAALYARFCPGCAHNTDNAERETA